MVAAFIIVGVSIISSTKAQAILKLGRCSAGTSNGATLHGPNGFCLSTLGQPPRTYIYQYAAAAVCVHSRKKCA
jgi:hypothetical protein